MRVLGEYYRRALLQHPDLLDFVQAALNGQRPKKVIVVPQGIVNVVV